MESKSQIVQRAPALILLVGMISGLILSKTYQTSLSFTSVVALAFAILSLHYAKNSKQLLWLASILAASTLGFWAYGLARLPEKPESMSNSLPIREARLTLKIQRVINTQDRFGRTTGIAKVLQAPELSRLGANNSVYFHLSKYDSSSAIRRGAIVELSGILEPASRGSEFSNFTNYLLDSGIYYLFTRTSELQLIRESPPFIRFCERTNHQLQNYLRLGAGEHTQLSNIYIAMLLGQKAELAPEQKDRFQTTGTMHLFAISGLHIGVVAAVFAQLLFLLRIPRSIRPIIGLPMLYIYVEVTGAAPSAVRAFLMVTFFWASFAFQRQKSPLSSLAASAVFVLLIQPNQLWQMGFQLSYLVVLSILLFGLPFHNRLGDLLSPYKYIPASNLNAVQRVWLWMSDKLLLLFAISFSAWLVSAPLIAGYFGVMAPYSVLINMILVNIAAIVISGGIISLLFALVTLTPMTAFLNHSAWICISAMEAIISMNIALPGAIIECPEFPRTMSYLAVAGYLALLYVFSSAKTRTLRFALPPLWVITLLFAGITQS